MAAMFPKAHKCDYNYYIYIFCLCDLTPLESYISTGKRQELREKITYSDFLFFFLGFGVTRVDVYAAF